MLIIVTSHNHPAEGIQASSIRHAFEEAADLHPTEHTLTSWTPKRSPRGATLETWTQNYAVAGLPNLMQPTGIGITCVKPNHRQDEDAEIETLLADYDIEAAIAICIGWDLKDEAQAYFDELDEDPEVRMDIAETYGLKPSEDDEAHAAAEHKAYVDGIAY